MTRVRTVPRQLSPEAAKLFADVVIGLYKAEAAGWAIDPGEPAPFHRGRKVGEPVALAAIGREPGLAGSFPFLYDDAAAALGIDRATLDGLYNAAHGIKVRGNFGGSLYRTRGYVLGRSVGLALKSTLDPKPHHPSTTEAPTR